jgi:GH24 family phage-related lysozyme (muramidase)
MAQIIYNGATIDFTDLMYAYLKVVEGYRNAVYADSKGIPTVGIGHRVMDSDNLSLGDVVDDSQVQAFFTADYARIGIDSWVTEIQDAGYPYNMMLAVGSFLWSHGSGQYPNSHLRSGLLADSFDAENIQTYLTSNWDTKSPVNQKRNAHDFTIGFDQTPWVPPFGFNPQNT